MHPCLWCVLNLGEINSAKEADLRWKLGKNDGRKQLKTVEETEQKKWI